MYSGLFSSIFLASFLITFAIFTHCLFSVKFNLSILIALLSFAIISQLFSIFAAICEVFHPGAAVISSTLSHNFRSSKLTGN